MGKSAKNPARILGFLNIKTFNLFFTAYCYIQGFATRLLDKAYFTLLYACLLFLSTQYINGLPNAIKLCYAKIEEFQVFT